MSQEEVLVHKVTLSTGKEVVLKEMEIGFTEAAAKAAAPRAGDNAMVMSIAMQQELLKILLLQVDGKDLKGGEKEQLKKLFSFQEYNQVLKAVSKIAGIDESGNFQLELVTSGSK